MNLFSKSVRPVSILSIFGFSLIASANEARDSADAFLKTAAVVKDEIAKSNPEESLIISSIGEMLQKAIPVLAAYSELHPSCDAQLKKIVELYPQIETWSAPEIRTKIESGRALPPGTGCYPARDIVAHPAIVRALSRSEITADLTPRLLRELNEATEHMEEIKATLPDSDR